MSRVYERAEEGYLGYAEDEGVDRRVDCCWAYAVGRNAYGPLHPLVMQNFCRGDPIIDEISTFNVQRTDLACCPPWARSVASIVHRIAGSFFPPNPVAVYYYERPTCHARADSGWRWKLGAYLDGDRR